MAKIFDKRTRTWREIEPKAYAEYMKYCCAFRKRQRLHGCCNCTKRMWWLCDTDCPNCEFQCEGNETLSLEASSFVDEYGNECSLEECTADQSELVENLFCDADELQHLLRRLEELMPEALQIGRLRESGMADAAIADKVGIKRTTINSRLKKVKEILSQEFPDWF